MKQLLYKFFSINKIGNGPRSTRVKWLKNKLQNIPSGAKILDAGAGELQFKKFCEHLNYVSQDFGQYDGKGDGSGLQTGSRDNSKLDIISDITDIPVEDESFDAVMCVEVLEHVPDPLSAIKEMTRVLKINGQLIITAPFFSLTHYAPYHFSTGFNKYYYQNHLSNLGYRIVEITPIGNYFDLLAHEVKGINHIAGMYGSKKLSWLELFASAILVRGLYKINNSQIDAENLACYGYLVHAIKGKLNKAS